MQPHRSAGTDTTARYIPAAEAAVFVRINAAFVAFATVRSDHRGYFAFPRPITNPDPPR